MAIPQLLLVEDSSKIPSSVRQQLEERYQCTFFSAVGETIPRELFDSAVQETDLVILDAKLAPMEINLLIEHCHSFGVSVFLLSEDSIESFESKPSFFMQKPFEFIQFIAAIELILEDRYQEAA